MRGCPLSCARCLMDLALVDELMTYGMLRDKYQSKGIGLFALACLLAAVDGGVGS